MGLSETFGDMNAKEKTLVIGGAALVGYFLFRAVRGVSSGTTVGTGAAVVDTTAAQASQTATAATNAQTENLSKLISDQNAATSKLISDQNAANAKAILDQNSTLATAVQGFQSDTEAHLATVQTNFNNALSQSQAANASAIQGLISQISAMKVVQPVAPTPSPIATSVSNFNSSSGSSNISSSHTAYNTIGGGTTSSKPSDVSLANGNTIKYDNGPHGWTEYNSSGDSVRAGTASPY